MSCGDKLCTVFSHQVRRKALQLQQISAINLVKENQQKAPGLFITAKEAGKLIGYAPDYIARLCREGKLEGKFVSGGWMVSYPHVLAYAESISQKKLAQAERLSAELKSVAAPNASGVKPASSASVSPITIVAPRALHTPATRAQVPTQFPSLAAPLQRATAVALSLVLVFGTYALVDQRAFASARDAVGETLARAIWPSEMAMYTPDSFAAAAAAPSISERIRNFFGWGDRASILVSVVPYAPQQNNIPVPTAPVASVPRVVAAPVRETMRERVVERVQYTPVFVSGGVSVADMALGLDQLDNKLSSRIALLSASLPGNTVVTPVTLAQATRIDQLNNTQITNPTITGGTITGSTISGLSFASISGTLGVSGGGTGTSTAPQFGELLVGNGAGGYQLLATSSLGIVGTGSGVPGGLAGQIQYNAGAGNFGGESGFAYDAAADRLSVVNASTTQISSAYASSTQGFFGTLSVGALSGVVRASGGAIATGTVNLANEVSGTLGISSGGTGTSSAPAYGQLLVGNTLGGYDFVSTSSLGLISSVSWGSITGTLSSQTDLQNALNAKLSLSD